MHNILDKIDLHAGKKYTIPVSFIDELGAPIPLTGLTIKWKMSRGTLDSFSQTAALTKTSAPAGGITITNSNGGLADLVIESDDADGLLGEYYHECVITDGFGDDEAMWAGEIEIHESLFSPA